MKKVLFFSLFMFFFGFTATAQIGPSVVSKVPTLSSGIQVIQNQSHQSLIIITSSEVVSLQIYNSDREVVWTGSSGYNSIDTSKFEEGEYTIVAIYPGGKREYKRIKIG